MISKYLTYSKSFQSKLKILFLGPKGFAQNQIVRFLVKKGNDIFLEENNFKDIDFMNLDVEGHESEVLKTIDFKKIKIRYICIEMIKHNDLSIKNSNQILGKLLSILIFFLL